MARKALYAVFIGFAVWLAAVVLSLKSGADGFTNSDVLFQLRLPRVLMATAVGMGLSVAGAVLQALFSNPLCEPYTLGVSSGAALGAVLGAWAGLPLLYSGLTFSAFGGALVFVMILYLASLRTSGSTLLLTGVMLGFFGSSLVAVVVALSDPIGVQGALFWLLGDLSRARSGGALISLSVALVLTLVLTLKWRALDALLMGDENARALGLDSVRERKFLLLICSVLVGTCVSGAGMVGFVGLVIPHFARRAVGSLHRKLIPVCAIWGATALVVADLLTRIFARPYELPVGVITALVGAPLFLVVLFKGRGRVHA